MHIDVVHVPLCNAALVKSLRDGEHSVVARMGSLFLGRLGLLAIFLVSHDPRD